MQPLRWFERKLVEAAIELGGLRRPSKGETTMAYVVRGLDPSPFQSLFGLPDEELERRGVVRMIVSRKPSFPCRVTLEDRDVGESMLLLNHVSHDVANPYRASHAIFITEGVSKPAEFIDEVPPVFGPRILSMRGFDSNEMMVDAALAQPGEADLTIRKMFADPAILTIHAHNAARGCFAAKIERN